jgi:hypothetical protein
VFLWEIMRTFAPNVEEAKELPKSAPALEAAKEEEEP